ncbi:MAG: hypothetical protein LBS84_10330 [Clostridiales bacterium]|nr:hypothetical protein [Clostridiales bacterium]
MKDLHTEENGAASVLIIFMMLVLVTLGAFSITAARVNYVFSGKALDWKTEYYECDALAEEFLMDFDAALAKAERGTAEAVSDRNGAAELTPESLERQFNSMYRNKILMELNSVRERYPGMDINEDGTVVSVTVSAGGKSRIEIKAAALPFRYSFDGTTAVLDKDGRRYSILEWKQSQLRNEGNAVQEPLWDGIVH